MKTDDFASFRELMQGVHDFYGKDLSKFALDVWWNALRQYDIEVIRRAMSMHCTNPDTGQFCPKPADVVRMVGGTTKDAAIMAWNKAMDAVSRAGAYRSVCFDDPIINRVLLDMGGWAELCAKPVDELPFVERNFCDRYRAYKVRGDSPGHPAYLVGLIEASNAQRGFKSEPPLLVGDTEQAQRVLLAGSDRPLIPIAVGAPVDGVVRRLTNAEAAA